MLLQLKLQESRERYFTVKLGRFVTENPAKFWQFLSQKDCRKINQIFVNGNALTDKKEIAESFNMFFQSVFTKPCSPMTQSLFEEFYDNGNMNTVSISTEGVTELLLHLDIKKSPGPDNIPNAFLKRYAVQVAPLLATIFQKSIDTATLPDDWRVAKVIPVFKKGSPLQIDNYRPISLTSCSCKMLEHILAKYINDFLAQKHVITDAQHGFRHGYSTVTQLVTTVHEFAKTLDQGGQIDLILLDFSKAFDRVVHSKLISKMRAIGLPLHIIHWVKTYLSNRKQYVNIDGSSSRFLDVYSGVPQGSVLGPLLFNIYINDIQDVADSSVCLKLFADDCVIFTPVNSVSDQITLNGTLNKLAEWCNKWEMVINLQKTVHMSITNKCNKLPFAYHIENNPLEEVQACKYLGITLTSTLNWSTHINNISSTARKKLGLLNHKLGESPPSLRLMTYKTMIRPSLEYGSAVWDPYTQVNIEKLEKIQRLAVRYVYKRFRRLDSPSAMLQLAELQPLSERRKEARLKFLASVYFGKLGIKTDGYLKKHISRASRHKHSHYIEPVFARTNLYKYSFFPRTIIEWNSLPSTSPMLRSNV